MQHFFKMQSLITHCDMHSFALCRFYNILTFTLHLNIPEKQRLLPHVCYWHSQHWPAMGFEVPSSKFQNELKLLPCTSPGCALFPILISTCGGRSSRNWPCPAFLCWSVVIMSLVSLCGRETKICWDGDLQKWSWVGKLPRIFNKLSANLPEDLMLWALLIYSVATPQWWSSA